MPRWRTRAETDDELIDLLAFLSALGREGGVTVPNAPFVRRREAKVGGGERLIATGEIRTLPIRRGERAPI